jgi:ABC-type nitrate/sulfonate/bicarbonate transport system substrate-binding protein
MTPYEQLVKQIEESFQYSNADAEEYAKQLKDMALEEYRKELEADDK